jgi:hypothetical protein
MNKNIKTTTKVICDCGRRVEVNNTIYTRCICGKNN